MSTNRIEELLNASIQEFIPVPRLAIKDIKEDALSKKLRNFDNAKISIPLPNQSGVYINTNEGGASDISSTLAKKNSILKPCHIGFSGWHNFDIIAQRLSARSLICDFNPENALFLHQVLLLVRSCDNRLQFIKKMTDFVKKNSYQNSRTNANIEPWRSKVSPTSIKFSLNVSDEPPYSGHYTVTEEVELELQRKTSWLYTDDRYTHIRKLALEDKIALITENICAFEKFNSIVRLLIDNMVQIDTVYVSNISEWIMSKKDRNSFFKTIQSFLADQDTMLIDARLLSSDSTIPTQRLITAGELNQSNMENWFYCKSPPLEENKEIEAHEYSGIRSGCRN